MPKATAEKDAFPVTASASSTDLERSACRRGPKRAARGKLLRSRFAE